MTHITNGGARRSPTDAAASPTRSGRARLGRIETILVEKGVVSFDALCAAKERQRGAKRPLVEVLLEQQAVDEDRLVEVLAEAVGMPVASAESLAPDPEVQGLVPPEVAQRLGLLPLRVADGVLVVATGDPLQIPAFDELALRTGLKVQAVFAKPSAVRAAIRDVRGGEDVLHEILKHTADDAGELSVTGGDAGARRGPAEHAIAVSADDAPTIRFVNMIVSDAIRQSASDVHVEAEKEAMKIRFRIDGELREILSVPSSLHASVVSRIKIVAGLDIIETRRPQDGRIKVTLGERAFDLRVSTIPSYFGEKVVLRVLDPRAATFDLDRCGMEPAVLARWRELIHRPHGLVLLTGPTGSGKTSTLYASLLELRDPSLNIVTVEDPVEYQFPGIVHVPVRSDLGMTFAAALRSILRQDPDVVLLGEIRDAETAQVAMQAAMTGHLVLSTLHTNDAVGAIARLLDLGVEPQAVASSLLGVMSQRLARRICADCAVPAQHPESELARLGYTGPLPTPATRRGAGCRKCRNSGLRGRTALVELVSVTPELGRLIGRRAPAGELAAQAVRDGTVALVEAGLRKVLAGECTPAEVGAVATRELDARPAERASGPAGQPALSDRCPNCNEVRETKWRFCPACGAAAAAAAPRGPSVLVCDDDTTARRLALLALRPEFPTAMEAADGASALAMIAASPPDLLVVDQEMPGMTGIDVIQALRSQLDTATLPILMLTASTDETMESVSLDAGADDYMQKPFTPVRLRTRARALIGARRRWSNAGEAAAAAAP